MLLPLMEGGLIPHFLWAVVLGGLFSVGILPAIRLSQVRRGSCVLLWGGLIDYRYYGGGSFPWWYSFVGSCICLCVHAPVHKVCGGYPQV